MVNQVGVGIKSGRWERRVLGGARWVAPGINGVASDLGMKSFYLIDLIW
jgi:hypothetical protein